MGVKSGGMKQKRERERERIHGHGQQCGDCRGGSRWVEVEEDVGGINGKEKYNLKFFKN